MKEKERKKPTEREGDEKHIEREGEENNLLKKKERKNNLLKKGGMKEQHTDKERERKTNH